MTLRTRRQAVALAEQACDTERLLWKLRTAELRQRLQPQHPAWLVGGGAASGFLAGLLPWRTGAGLARLAISASGFLLQSSTGIALLESVRLNLMRRTGQPDRPSAETTQTQGPRAD